MSAKSSLIEAVPAWKPLFTEWPDAVRRGQPLMRIDRKLISERSYKTIGTSLELC